MSGQKTPGTVFIDDSVDTGPAPKAPAAPVSSGDIIGAHWTLGYQDMAGQPLQAKIDAYTPIINELDKRDDRGWLDRIFGPQYILGVRGGLPINTNKVWADVAAIRAKDPNFLKDVPATNDEEFDSWVKGNEKGKRTKAQDIVSRERGVGQSALGFATGIGTSLVDPINLGGMALTGPLAGGAKSLLGTMARDAVTNMAIETVELPAISSNRAQFGETMTPLDMVGDVGMAGVAGAAFPLATRGIKGVAGAVSDGLAPVGQAAQRYFVPWAMSRAGIENATDADVARMFAETVPKDARTPDAQAGLDVLTREAEVRGASPYTPSPGGLDANAERLGAVSEALSQPASAGRTPPAPRPVPRTTAPLTQDNIIRFVINDLEGGAKVVPFSQADGGTTKYGVAKKFNPDVDVANITEADAMRIARQRYWLPEFNTVDPRVASIAFDANWISSPSLARKIIREAGNDVDKALDIYRARLNEIADTVPGKGKFRRGWNNRVDRLARYVGEAEHSTVRLEPEQFNGDDVAYRAAQEDLNREELRLADDTPSTPNPVREYVDRQLSGDDLSSPADRQFAAVNADEISAELAQRATNGTDVHPIGSGQAPVRLVDANAPSPAETALAVREYVRNGMGDLSPKNVAKDLGVTPAEVRGPLSAFSKEQGPFSLTPDWEANYAHAYALSRKELEQVVANGPREAQVDEGVLTREMAAELLREHQDYSGFTTDALTDTIRRTLIEQRRPDWIDRVRAGRATSDQQAAFVRLGGAMAALKARNELAGLEKGLLRNLVDRGWSESDAREVLSGRLTNLQNAARPRLPEPEFVEPTAPPSLDPKTYGVDTPTDPEAHLLADSAYHDVKALADAGDTTKAQLTEGGPEMGAKELIESIDRDQSALDAIKGCL